MDMLHSIEQSNASVIILDIDGTLKDLCKEHSVALQMALRDCNVESIRKEIILFLNKCAMGMVKTGFFMTNNSRQKFLVSVFAILSGKKGKHFKEVYFKNYSNQIFVFDGIYELLKELKDIKTVYFATINRQNYNLEACGIPQERIVYTKGALKVTTYRKILNSIKAEKQEVVIVGDNIFDDLLSAKLLGVKCLLVNRYNSKLKALFCKLVNRKYLK